MSITIFRIAIFFVFFHFTPVSNAQPMNFRKGDASFAALVHRQSRFLKGDLNLDCPYTFCNNQYFDVTGISLNIGHCPEVQINAVRQVCKELLNESSFESGLFLFATHPEFDFAKHWLGVPYNRDDPILPKGSIKINCFGPTGASSLSMRDAHHVPSLNVAILEGSDYERYSTTEECCICAIKVEDAIFQRHRTIISHDGSIRTIQFEYEPKYRIGFEDGDVFFVAKADPFFEVASESVTLSYLESRPKTFFFHDKAKELVFSFDSDDLLRSQLALPIEARGSRLTVKNAPKDLSGILESEAEKGKRWYVFVLDAEYDVEACKLGIRYNRGPLALTTRPLPFDFVECNFCVNTYPSGSEEFVWPTRLPVVWQGDSAFVDFKDIQLVFCSWFEDMPFDSYAMTMLQVRISAKAVQVWRNGRLLR